MPLAYTRTLISPLDYVTKFISKQPDNYRLGFNLFKHRIFQWWIWREHKDDIQKKIKKNRIG